MLIYIRFGTWKVRRLSRALPVWLVNLKILKLFLAAVTKPTDQMFPYDLKNFLKKQVSSRSHFLYILNYTFYLWAPDGVNVGLWWCNRQGKRLSPLRSWVWISVRTCCIHARRVSQRSVQSRGFSPGTPVASHLKCWQGWLRIKIDTQPTLPL